MNFFKKNWFYVVPASLLLSPLLILFYISISYGYDFGESLAVLQSLTKENTKYQHMNFTETKFRQVTPGMTGRQVYELLGIPLERQNNDTLWLYSVGVGGTGYWHERSLIMDKGKVKEVICRFHTPESK